MQTAITREALISAELNQQRHKIFTRTDRLFAVLMVCQWAVAVLLAILERQTFASAQTPIEQHSLAVVAIGGIITGFALFLIYSRPGAAVTRHAVAIAQALISGLLIGISGGRGEMQLHVFVSFALLALYRDWGVLVTASAVIAADHLALGIWTPQSAGEAAYFNVWSSLRHLGWELSENAALFVLCRRSISEMRSTATRYVELQLAVQDSRHLADIVEWSEDAIKSETLDGIVTSWNRGAVKMYGFAAEEIVGRAVVELVPEGRADEVNQNLERIKRGERVEPYDTVRVRKDGTQLAVSMTVSPIKDAAGNVIGASSIARDVTRRQEAERESKRIQKELSEAKQAAESANLAKSKFLANMSHEIRTPLNGVIGLTSLLLNTALDEQQRAYCEMALASGENLLMIVNDILDFEKIEAGKMEIETTDFNLYTAFESAVKMLAQDAQNKGLELAGSIEPSVPAALRGDPFRLKQVLINLIGNAIKFTEHGSVVVRAKIADETDTAATVRFEVKDTGVGISTEAKSRLFQSFSQANTATTRMYGGTGLGLAICKQLVRLMGGEIGLESEIGVGSLFWFALPLLKQHEERQSRLQNRLTGLRVLVVEGNVSSREILHEQICAWQMRNGSVDTGPAALQLLEAAVTEGDPYGIAILDMPETRAVMLARTIKADSRLSDLKIVLLTQIGAAGSSEEARAAGISAFISKPVRQSELYDTLVALLDSEHMADNLAAQSPRRFSIADAHRDLDTANHARILVAEDNAVNRAVAKGMLAHLGYSVDVVSTGREAVDAILREPYDVVFMDCQMPELDGYSATREIRQREGAGRHTPIIAITANALAGEREKCLDAGMDDHIPKPLVYTELKRVLNRWLPCYSRKAEEAKRMSDFADDRIDHSALDALRELQESSESDVLEKLIRLFVSDTPDQLQRLRNAIDKKDSTGIARVAHLLRSSAGNLGARKMVQLCAELESSGRLGKIETAPSLLGQLEMEFEHVRSVLTEAHRSR